MNEATAYFYQVVALRADTESPKSDTIDVATPASSIRSVPRQSTTPSTQTLVSSIDRATHHMEYLIAKDLAQGFRTGPHPTGYKLSSVDLYVTGANDLTVQLVESSAGNQQTVALLIPPNRSLIGHDVYSFSTPANTTLAPNKDYWIVVKGNGWFHATTGEATSPARGWELADSYDYRGPAASSSVTPRGPMPRLQNLAAAADDQEVTLSWDNPGDHGITGYQYRHQATTETGWNPNWTDVPSSNAGTTSHTVRPLVNLTAYTFEVRAMRGLEEGPASSTSATTPDGPADVPKEPRKLSVHEEDQGFTASWGKPPDEDERAPVTSYLVRHRKIGTSPWQNVTVISDECCSKTITGLTNRLHYEAQAAAVNRLGTGPWAGPVNVTPQAPATQPPAPTGDANLSLGQIGQGWETTANNTLIDSCTGTKSFRIIWNGPDGHSRKADQWAAHINTNGGAGVVSYSFTRSPGQQEYYEMNGTVNFQGAGNTTIHVRGRFGPTWGTWSRITLYCFEQ